jgi:enhancing lycopene biosynthesis protein 2
MASKFGHKMSTSSHVDDVVSDPENRIVTTPAYMQANAKPHEVFDGISKFITHVTYMVK